MEKIQGIVEQVSNKETNYGIKINNEWYNGFSKSPVNKGDHVEVEFEDNSPWKNIKKITVIQAKAAEGSLNKTTTMYVSYAKDILVASLNRLDSNVLLTDKDLNVLMDGAVDLVKRAKERFETNDMPEVQETQETNQA